MTVQQPAQGFFFCLEGMEGVGKSTQIQQVAQALRAQGYDVLTTREPGGTPMAEAIRGVLVQTFDEDLDPNTTLMLMFAARNQHIKNTILPALAAGKIVLCDRYIDSSYVLQVLLDGASQELFYSLTMHVARECIPDLTVVLQTSMETGRERSIAGGRGGIDRYDQADDAKRQTMADNYAKFATLPGHVGVDGEQPVEVVTGSILAVLEAQLQAKVQAEHETDTAIG